MTKRIKSPFALDVSSWKGAINWDAVHPLPDLVVCQASNGIQEADDFFKIHWHALNKMNIKKGAYHSFDPEVDGRLQVSNFLESVEQAGGFDDDCIPPILDASTFQCLPRKVSLEKRLRQCLHELKEVTGQTPIVNMSRRYWGLLRDRKGNYPDWANEYLLWISWLPSDPDIYKCPPKNTLPNGWENWAMWRYDESATISGIKGYVSLSTLSEWYAAEIGISHENHSCGSSSPKRLKIKATIVASEGVVVRRRSLMTSKMLTFLAKDSELVGESIEFVNMHEAWLQVTKPISGWCPIVHTGRTYLSIKNRQ